MNKLMVAVVAGVVAFGAQAETKLGMECIDNGTFESDDMSAWKASRTTNNNNDWAVKSTGLQGSYCIYIWQTSSATCTFIAPEGGKYAFSMLSAARGSSYTSPLGHWTAVSIDDQEPFLNFQDNSLAAQLREAEITLTKGEHVLKLKGSIEGTKDQSSVYDNISLKFLLPDTAIEPPTYSPYSVIFNGENQCVTFSLVEHLVFGGVTNATAVGKYEFTLTPEEGYTWSDFTTDTKTFYWEILAVQNGWTTVPFVTRTRYVVGDAVTVSAGEPKFGEVVATLDGEPFDPSTDDLPQEPGEHALVFTVPAGESYSSLYYAFNLIVFGSESSGEIGTRSLPSEYLPLDYISSESSFGSFNGANGGAYIKLDFPLATTDRVQTKVVFALTDNNNNGAVFCMRKSTTDPSYTLFRLGANMRFDYNMTQEPSKTSVAKDTPYEIDVHDGKVFVNGGAEPFITNEQEPFDVSGTALGLFASNVDNTFSNFSKMRMYYFYVFDDAGKVTHELVPAKRASDSVVGLYDLRTDAFWPSANASRAFNAPAASDANFLTRLASSPNRANSSPYASGGDVILYDGNTYVHVFTNAALAGSFQFVKDMPKVDLLLVGGGGGGGSNRGGGGGAGGYVYATDLTMEGGEYVASLGIGGAAGANGKDTVFARVDGDATNDVLRAFGGGRGGGKGAAGAAGGCGGGTGSECSATEPALGLQGCNGGISTSTGKCGSGGGGAGANGQNGTGTGSWDATTGGKGLANCILGFEQYFAGGGGGAAQESYNATGTGGKGGGGSGVKRDAYNTEANRVVMNGVDGLGGGGAGGSASSSGSWQTGGKGGSGIVVIAYQTAGVPKPSGGKIARPTAIPDLVYNGSDQMGVAEGAGYTITGHFAALGGNHMATATLEDGFEWSDGSTEPAEIAWFIAAAKNVWTTAPAIATQHYGKDQAGDIVLTAGVARYGEVVATIAKDGGESTAFGGALPAVPGTYELAYFVDADPSWTGLTNKLTFTVYPFEIKPWANSFIADLTTNANRVVSSEFAEGGDMVLKYPGKDGARDTYVHVFTDTSADSVFTVAAGKRLADAEVLVVGGGGGAGNGKKGNGPWDFCCAGGGDGGDVVVTNGLPIVKTFSVHVGKGGKGGGGTGEASSFTGKNGAVSVVAQGGQGGLGASTMDGVPRTGKGGAGQPDANTSVTAEQYGLDGVLTMTLGCEQYFGGGGAGSVHSENTGNHQYLAKGGKGGGGACSANSGDSAQCYANPGTDGLGGGGAGGWMTGGLQDSAGRAGGSGIVVIRYSKVSSAGLLLFVK